MLLKFTLLSLLLIAQSDRPPASPPDQAAGTGSATTRSGNGEEREALSTAERIARLQRAIADSQRQIDELTTRLQAPESEYAQAEKEFRGIDELLEQAKRAADRLREESSAESVLELAAQDTAMLQKRWTLARERFDLAIQERKAAQSSLSALEQRMQEDRAALAKLSPGFEPKGSGEGAQLAPGADGKALSPPDLLPATKAAAAAPQNSSATPTSAQPEMQPSAAPPPVQLPGHQVGATRQIPEAQPLTGDDKAPDERIVKAQEEATSREQVAQEAAATARSIMARMDALRQSVEAERSLLKTAQRQVDNAYETKQALNEEMQTRWSAGEGWAELRDLRQNISEADKRITGLRQEIRERTERLDSLQAELSVLQSERLAAVQEADAAKQQADAAKQQLAELSNPFAPQNMLQWVLDHGPKILGIIAGMIILLAGARIMERRMVPIIAKHGRAIAGSLEERENRARTLLSVFHNAMRIFVIVGGSLMLLAELGMNIVPLITAAGVVGLAIAFGAQNLIRDYFYGFIILLENQYQINDVIKIGDISGLVERITLRITVLRDLEGTVHFLPHGEVKSVSNMTHGWSRALFDIGVAYKENTDRVIQVLKDLGREMRRDPEYSSVILDEPEMLGVNQLGDSAVVIRFFLKTRPQKQWGVKRELLRRIKNKFDELGIEIPFPHQTVYNRFDGPNGEAHAEEERLRAGKWEAPDAYARR